LRFTVEKGYLNPKIVLTRLDTLELKLKYKYGKFLSE